MINAENYKRFEVRFAQNSDDVAAAQALRYRVFYEEMGATPQSILGPTFKDTDGFDDICDHLLVVDTELPAAENVIGTYRLLRKDTAMRFGGFYSSDEYDLGPLIEGPWGSGGLLELGRSCVHPNYRNNGTIQLLWKGITNYINFYEIDVMFGCASFLGITPSDHALALSYLHYNHLVPAECWVKAQSDRFVNMRLIPQRDFSTRDALVRLPPLIKAYLRLGAFVGEGAVVDHVFGTTDVFIVLPVAKIPQRYLNRFHRPFSPEC